MNSETQEAVKGLLDGVGDALRERREIKWMEEERNNEYWLQEVDIRKFALDAALSIVDPDVHHDRSVGKVIATAKMFETFLFGETEEAE